MPTIRECQCGSGKHSWWTDDARGIPLFRSCTTCHDSKAAKYRPDVFTDSQYSADEPIDEEY